MQPKSRFSPNRLNFAPNLLLELYIYIYIYIYIRLRLVQIPIFGTDGVYLFSTRLNIV
jgi:hypothetical protein